MLKCDPGYYQDVTAQIECKECTIGNYCQQVVDGAGALVSGTVTPVTCEAGHYCPAGTAEFSRFPCPLGTYNTLTGKQSADDCTKCDSTFYCPEKGMQTTGTFKCQAGYICDTGS